MNDSEVQKISAGASVGQESAKPMLPELGEGGERQRVVRGEEAKGGALEGGVPGVVREEESAWQIEQGEKECRRAEQRGEVEKRVRAGYKRVGGSRGIACETGWGEALSRALLEGG